MNDYTYRIMFVYEYGNYVASIVFMGDGTHINPRHKLRIGVTDYFEKMVFEEQDERFIVLFKCLESLNSKFITELNMIQYINKKTDFNGTHSVAYKYKYDKLGSQVFKNVLRRNGLIDFNELVGGEN